MPLAESGRAHLSATASRAECRRSAAHCTFSTPADRQPRALTYLESPLYYGAVLAQVKHCQRSRYAPELLWPQRDSRRRAPVRARSVRTSHRSSLDDARHTSGEGTGKTHYCDRITQTRATATTTAISERLPGQTATATDAERGISGAIPSHAISVTTCSSSAPRGSKPVPAQHDIRESAGRHRTSCSVPPGGTSLPAPGRTGAAR